jgi:hypothetical protein
MLRNYSVSTEPVFWSRELSFSSLKKTKQKSDIYCQPLASTLPTSLCLKYKITVDQF